jgi:hypothetical protein
LTALSPHDLDDEHHDVLFIDDINSFLSRGLVGREHGRGRRVIGVFDPVEPTGRDHLISLGVDAVISCEDLADAFVSAARRLAVPASAASTPTIPESVDRTSTPTGVLVGVHGVSGGVGTTEVALGLATALRRATVVELGPLPSLAQRIGLDTHPNLATAVELMDHGPGRIDQAVQRVDGGPRVLVGVTETVTTGRGAARRVIEGVRAGCPWTVLDGGHSAMTPLPTDHTVVVTVGTPVGIARCVDALRSRDVIDTHVLINRSPRGGFERSEVMGAVLSEVRPRSVTIAPEDSAVATAAWNGRLVAAGGFTRAIAALAAAVSGAA